MRPLLLALALALATPALTLDVAYAADPGAEVAMDEPLDGLADELGPPGPVPDTEALDALTWRISKGLRCPVCQGSSIQDSPVDSAVNMRKRVRELAARGYDEGQIQEYFVTRYGEWILLAPRASGLNWLVWLGPALGGGLALAILGYVITRWRQEPDPVPLPSETGAIPLDEYEQRLLEEIEG